MQGHQTNENVVIDNKHIKSAPSVELLRIQLDDKLNFSPHIKDQELGIVSLII